MTRNAVDGWCKYPPVLPQIDLPRYACIIGRRPAGLIDVTGSTKCYGTGTSQVVYRLLRLVFAYLRVRLGCVIPFERVSTQHAMK